MKRILEKYKEEMEQELQNILSYWIKFAIDDEQGGFIGRIDRQNKRYPEAPKGSVLNSRILWTFSAAYDLTKNEQYRVVAERAFQYFVDNFIDNESGGVYWTVDHLGNPLDTKKQIYALAFAVYGLSEYYHAVKNEKAKEMAITIYKDLVKYSYDEKYGGYTEAFSRDWKTISDFRLSDKDANEKKSMNTHLHVLEAFVNLYRINPAEILKQKINELIALFIDHIISGKKNHLVLFFDDEWNERSQIISYGHDIEAAWLVQEAAEITGEISMIHLVKQLSLNLANAASEGLDEDGGVWYEFDVEKDYLIREKHSWPQAEAMVGFFNAWQNTGDEIYLNRSLQSWQFIKNYIHDKKGGEWYWGVNDDYSPISKDKVGIWKCPYHNIRACIEIIKRTSNLLN